MDVETRAAALILRGDAPLVPLSELHRTLAAEANMDTGDLATLRERLHARPDLFLLLERPAPLLGAEHWPEGDRAAYRAALREAGFEAETLVGTAPAGHAKGWVDRRGGCANGGSRCEKEAAAAATASAVAPAPPATPATRVAAALAQLAATVPEEHLLRGRLAEALPLAEATMRVLAEAWRAREQAEREGWVPLQG